MWAVAGRRIILDFFKTIEFSRACRDLGCLAGLEIRATEQSLRLKEEAGDAQSAGDDCIYPVNPWYA
jgi:hypothetical protein